LGLSLVHLASAPAFRPFVVEGHPESERFRARGKLRRRSGARDVVLSGVLPKPQSGLSGRLLAGRGKPGTPRRYFERHAGEPLLLVAGHGGGGGGPFPVSHAGGGDGSDTFGRSPPPVPVSRADH